MQVINKEWSTKIECENCGAWLKVGEEDLFIKSKSLFGLISFMPVVKCKCAKCGAVIPGPFYWDIPKNIISKLEERSRDSKNPKEVSTN